MLSGLKICWVLMWVNLGRHAAQGHLLWSVLCCRSKLCSEVWAGSQTQCCSKTHPISKEREMKPVILLTHLSVYKYNFCFVLFCFKNMDVSILFPCAMREISIRKGKLSPIKLAYKHHLWKPEIIYRPSVCCENAMCLLHHVWGRIEKVQLEEGEREIQSKDQTKCIWKLTSMN